MKKRSVLIFASLIAISVVPRAYSDGFCYEDVPGIGETIVLGCGFGWHHTGVANSGVAGNAGGGAIAGSDPSEAVTTVGNVAAFGAAAGALGVAAVSGGWGAVAAAMAAVGAASVGAIGDAADSGAVGDAAANAAAMGGGW